MRLVLSRPLVVVSFVILRTLMGIIAMALTRGHAAIEEHAAHAPATGKVTAT